MQSSQYDLSTWAAYHTLRENSMLQSTFRGGARLQRQSDAVVPKVEHTALAVPAGPSTYDRWRTYRSEYALQESAYNPALYGSRRTQQGETRHNPSADHDHYYEEPSAAQPNVGGNVSDSTTASRLPEETTMPFGDASQVAYDFGGVALQRAVTRDPHGFFDSVDEGRWQGGDSRGPRGRNQLLARYSTIADALTPVVDDHLPYRPPQAEIGERPRLDDHRPYVPNYDTDGDGPTKGRTGPKRHMCTICQKVFPRPGGLQTHMNAHNNVKPFACGHDGCSMCFSVQSNARRHRRNAHGIGFAEQYEDAQRHLPIPQPDINFEEPVVNEQADCLAVPRRLLWMPPNNSLEGPPFKQ